jgi:hypothetical protein
MCEVAGISAWPLTLFMESIASALPHTPARDLEAMYVHMYIEDVFSFQKKIKIENFSGRDWMRLYEEEATVLLN